MNPLYRKADSVLYPTRMPITVTGLIQFAIANSQPLVRWQALFEVCNKRCLLRNLDSYTREFRRVRRLLRSTRVDLYRIKRTIVWPFRFRHEKHEHECRSFVAHLTERRRLMEGQVKSLAHLLDLLGGRIRRHVTRSQNELTRDLVHDMLMLIQEPSYRRPSGEVIKKKKGKKSSGKRKKDRDEL